jgi:hypothetical protein
MVPISPSFDITCPGPEAVVPIGQIQRGVLKRNLASFNINHISRISITHWTEKSQVCHGPG